MNHQPPAPSPAPAAVRAGARALQVAALYGLFASLWILFSDHLVALWIGDPKLAQVVGTLKGWGFVGATSGLLYVLVRRQLSAGPGAADAAGGVWMDWPARHHWPRWAPYLLAVAATLAMLFLRMQVAVGFGDRPLLILVMFPILFSAMVGGLGPGLTATLCAALGIGYTAIPPVGSLRIAASHDLLQWGFLIANGVLVSVLSEQMHRARQRVEALAHTRERARALFKQLIETLPDLVWLKDPQGVYLACNRRFERFFGAPEAEILGRTDHDFLPRELADFFRAQDRAAIAAGHPVVNEEELCFADDGHREWVETIKTPMHDAAGNLIGVLGIARDISAARETARALRAGEEHIALAQEAAQAGTWEWDLATNGNYWSDSLWALYGLAPHSCEPTYGAWLATIHPEDRERVDLAVAAAAAVGGEYEVEWRVLSPAGEPERWLLARGRPLPGPDDRPERYIGIVLDISERKRTTMALRLWADAFENCTHGIAIGAPETNTIRACNPAYATLLGYTPEEIVGMSIPALYAEAERARLLSHIALADRTGRMRLETRMRRKDGTSVEVQLDVVSVPAPDGRVRYRVATIQDIGERKRAEQAIRTSERRFQDIARASADWIWEIDVENRYTYVSEGVQAMLGYAPEAVLGKTPFDLMPPEEAARVGQAFAAIAARREPFRDLDNLNRRKDGRLVCVQTNGVPILDPAGRLTGYRGLDRDVTGQRQLERELARYREHLEDLVVSRTAELRQARTEAERLARVKGDFLANMSHEIRTPLNAVLGFARIGLRDSPAGGVSRAFSQILGAGEHLLGVINDILDYSKIEAGKLGVEVRPFELAAVVASAGAFVSGIAAQKGIGYSAVLAPDLPGWVRGDSQRLQQVLANLLSNAVKFTQAGEVRLQVSRDGDDIRFHVSDTGIGMSKEQCSRLFTPFEQADGSTTRRFGGSGLGLAISRQLVVLMGGEIGVESTPAIGSTFSLRLPLPATEPQRGPERLGALEAPEARRLAGVRVLAAEDVEVNRLVLEDLLHYEGAAVRFAENGREALALIESLGAQSFDIALMDVQMPEMDGYAATRELRRLAPALPVIGLTAFALAEERDRCLEVGMVDHVTKPVDPERLVAAIRRHLVQTAPPAAAQPGPAPGPDAGVSAIVDWPGLMKRFGGRRAFLQKLATITLKSEADTPKRLHQVAVDGDARSLAFMAHGLKGVTGNLMAQSVYELARATEQAAREESPERLRLARDLAQATERLLAELAEWSGRSDPVTQDPDRPT